jgi:hypothetical protein
VSRRAWLDVCPGERRGVVTLDGRPERLLIEREDDSPGQRLGARVAVRIRAVEPASRLAFLDMGEGPAATTPLAAGLTVGAAVEVEVVAEARRGKGAVVRVLGPATGGAPRLLAPGPTLEARLAAWAPEPAVTGERAREAAEAAEEAALATVHALRGGGDLAIEATRALVAVDVDLGTASGDAAQAARRVNGLALEEAARLLRLKALGGLVVIDLVGGGQGGHALLTAAKAAFEPDQPGVAFGPLSRFGLLQLARPWRETPAAERLLDAGGRRSARTRASDALRALERAGRHDPGGRFEAVLAPDAAALAAPWAARLGPRFSLRGDVAWTGECPDIRRP